MLSNQHLACQLKSPARLLKVLEDSRVRAGERGRHSEKKAVEMGSPSTCRQCVSQRTSYASFFRAISDHRRPQTSGNEKLPYLAL